MYHLHNNAIGIPILLSSSLSLVSLSRAVMMICCCAVILLLVVTDCQVDGRIVARKGVGPDPSETEVISDQQVDSDPFLDEQEAHDEKIGSESMAPMVVYDQQHPHGMKLQSLDLLPKLYIADE